MNKSEDNSQKTLVDYMDGKISLEELKIHEQKVEFEYCLNKISFNNKWIKKIVIWPLMIYFKLKYD